ncbi:MAG TPA: hypothetical protein VN663_22875 [Ramlibacter sp.]|nr:hypothetical protein [Ramlibacter sp.]
MLGLPRPAPSLRVVPKAIHNEDGTVRALARQMLMDLDRDSLNTSVPTATLEMLLTSLCDALNRPPLPAPPAVDDGAMLDVAGNPNLAYWVRKAADDLDAADNQ